MAHILKKEAAKLVEDLKLSYGPLAGPVLFEAVLHACDVERGFVTISTPDMARETAHMLWCKSKYMRERSERMEARHAGD